VTTIDPGQAPLAHVLGDAVGNTLATLHQTYGVNTIGLLHDSGVELDNGVVVNEYCASNIHGIYAAGDVANHYHPVFGRRIRVEHWQNAQRQGLNAARNMAGQRVASDDIPWFWSDQSGARCH
jgi:NADPH-dependent 2,4-dienoyl-CoA reductase/sulfur reductase-like enzyme